MQSRSVKETALDGMAAERGPPGIPRWRERVGVRAAPHKGPAVTPERHPRDVMKEHDIRPKKAWGQNFLVSAENLERVAAAAEVSGGDVILEIGTGLGSLTERLAARARLVI